MHKSIVALSGGMDSATVLAYAKQESEVKLCVSFRYGSKHGEWEKKAAMNVANYFGQVVIPIDLSSAFMHFKSDLLKSGGAIPEGHYEAESMRRTVVPCRNVIFISILSGLAESLDCSDVWLGVHEGDHYIYPDCRSTFIHSMRTSVQHATERKVMLRTPFLGMDKAGILSWDKHANEGIKTPYHLTRTCYKDQELACGVCGSCQERLSAFKSLGIEDPLPYVSRELMPRESVDSK